MSDFSFFLILQEKEKEDISLAIRLAAANGNVSVFNELLETNKSLNIDVPNDVRKLE